MSSKKARRNMVELLKSHEEALSQLYDAFARNFLDHKDFWFSLSGDESLHAQMIDVLFPKVQEGSVDLDENRFKRQTIQGSLDYLREVHAKTSKGEILPINAFSIALDIERGMVEKKFFEVFDGDSEELAQILSNLDADTRRHARRIQRAWARYRQLPS